MPFADVMCGSVVNTIKSAFGQPMSVANPAGEFAITTQVEFSCIAGFSFVDPTAPHYTTCLADGSWSPIETISHCFCTLISIHLIHTQLFLKF